MPEDLFMDEKPLILGHRGMGVGEGENSLLSLVKAVQIGADGVELDVALTSDGVVVLTHDSNLKRIVGLDREVSKITFKELKRKGFINLENLTTLEKVYLELPESAFINVEVKAPEAAKYLVSLIRSFNALERTLFSSFEHDCLLDIRDLYPRAKLGLLIGEEAKENKMNPLEYFQNLLTLYKPYSLNLPVQMFEEVGFANGLEFIKFIRKTGVKVALWTLNDPELFLKLKESIDIVITDNLQGILALLGGKKKKG